MKYHLRGLVVILVLALCAAWWWFVYVPAHRREGIPPPGSVRINIEKGAVINIEQGKSDDLWRVDVYCGEVRTRMPNGELDRSLVEVLKVDGKAKDSHAGRLAIEELRELLKSQEIVHIRPNWNQGVSTEVTIQKGLGTRLNLQDSP